MKNLEFNTKEEILIKLVAFLLQKRVPKGARKVQNAIFGGGQRTGTQDFVLLSQISQAKHISLTIFPGQNLAEMLW